MNVITHGMAAMQSMPAILAGAGKLHAHDAAWAGLRLRVTTIHSGISAAQAIPVLQGVIPLRRADMRLKLQVAPAAEHDLELLLRQHGSVIEKQEASPLQVSGSAVRLPATQGAATIPAWRPHLTSTVHFSTDLLVVCRSQ